MNWTMLHWLQTHTVHSLVSQFTSTYTSQPLEKCTTFNEIFNNLTSTTFQDQSDFPGRGIFMQEVTYYHTDVNASLPVSRSMTDYHGTYSLISSTYQPSCFLCDTHYHIVILFTDTANQNVNRANITAVKDVKKSMHQTLWSASAIAKFGSNSRFFFFFFTLGDGVASSAVADTNNIKIPI